MLAAVMLPSARWPPPRKTDVALVLGTGPSLDQFPPGALDHVESYGTNTVHLHLAPLGRCVDHIVVTDPSRHQVVADFYKDKPEVTVFVGDKRYANPPTRRLERQFGRPIVPLRQLCHPRRRPWDGWLDRLPLRQRLNGHRLDTQGVSLQLSRGLHFGASVVISALQLAASRGHPKILLCGVDASYSGPTQYCQAAEKAGLKPALASFQHGPYNFRVLLEPQLVRLQQVFEKLGIQLIDCTPGGKLRFLPKGQLQEHLPR